MRKRAILVACGLSLLLKFAAGLTVVDYMNQVCDTSVSVSESRALESHSNLIYAADMSCYYHVRVSENYKVQAIFERFVLESQVNGACVDYVNIHDGDSVSSATLNTAALCGSQNKFTLTSTGRDLTVYFRTDSTGNKQGFLVLFTAISTAPCLGSQFACNNSLCVDSTLQCDNFDHCGDGSDEYNCPAIEAPGVYDNPDTPLIVGLTVSLSLLLVVGCVVAFFCWRYNRWRFFLRQEIEKPDIPQHPTTFNNAYPVTKFYYQEKFQKHFKDVDKPFGEEWRNDREVVLRELSAKPDKDNVPTPTHADRTRSRTRPLTQQNVGPEPEMGRQSSPDSSA